MSYFAFLTEHGPTLLLGTVTTIKVLICSTILYVIISMIFGLMRLSKNPAIQGIATVYIEFFTRRFFKKEWKKIESEFDANNKKIYKSGERKLINGLNLKDVLIFENWIDFAKKEGDESYKILTKDYE